MRNSWAIHGLSCEGKSLFTNSVRCKICLLCLSVQKGKRLGITVFQPRLKVCTFARTNYYEYGKQRQVQESP